MQKRHTRESGAVLLMALISLIIVTMLAASLFSSALAQMKLSKSSKSARYAEAPAEGALEIAEQRLLTSIPTLLTGSGKPDLPSDVTGSVTYAIDTDYANPNGDGTNQDTVTVNYTISDDFTIDGLPAGDQVKNAGHWEADSDGVQTYYRNYLVWADAQTHNATTRSVRIVEAGLTPLFQYAVFYDGDLEILPGPSMTLSGRVHSNSNIYTGCGAGNTLTINADYFRCAGSIYRERKDDGSATVGTLNIKVKNQAKYYQMLNKAQMLALGFPSTSGFDSLFMGYDSNKDGDLNDPGDYPDFTVGATTLWQGTVGTEAMGVKSHAPPPYGTLQMYDKKGDPSDWGDYNYNASTKQWTPADPPGSGDYNKGNYYQDAALTIVQDVNNPSNWIAKDSSGKPVTLRAGTLTNKTMYDAREGKTVKILDIDMKLLTQDYDANKDGTISAKSGDYIGHTGLIYVARRDDVDPNSGTVLAPNGVRLSNGGRLYGAETSTYSYDSGETNKSRTGATTVVTEDPLYVKGDYNTGAGDATKKMPAAVIADAVNLLSNGWESGTTWSGDGKKDKGELPKATATTFNTAMITGANSTVGSQYSGGFENLPRFHENWDSVNCKIRGSFVNIYKSQIAKGAWVYGGDHYTAPIRDWDYDPSFNDLSKLPPYTPMAGNLRTRITVGSPPPGWPPAAP
jgi:Tfp pilus assembly protein PilX